MSSLLFSANKKSMFELAGTKYVRGVFELYLQKKAPGGRLANGFLSLGPIKGRFIALIFFLSAGFLEVYRQPLRLLVEKGWVSNLAQAVAFQKSLGWFLMVVGFLIYFMVFVFRPSTCRLVFDKMGQSLSFEKVPFLTKARVVKEIVPFSNIKEIRVFRNGIEIKTLGNKTLDKGFSFLLLTDEQRQFFPLNISKITGVTPTGDWVDPEEIKT